MFGFLVPNAPCGVERHWTFLLKENSTWVPNAPCGVESGLINNICTMDWKFLMHRVELKGLSDK